MVSKAHMIHDATIDGLVKRLEASGDYAQVLTKVEYFDNGKLVGEIDVLGLNRNGEFEVYEVKSCSKPYHRWKATQQLRRFHKFCKSGIQPSCYYVTPGFIKKVTFK